MTRETAKSRLVWMLFSVYPGSNYSFYYLKVFWQTLHSQICLFCCIMIFNELDMRSFKVQNQSTNLFVRQTFHNTVGTLSRDWELKSWDVLQYNSRVEERAPIVGYIVNAIRGTYGILYKAHIMVQRWVDHFKEIWTAVNLCVFHHRTPALPSHQKLLSALKGVKPVSTKSGWGCFWTTVWDVKVKFTNQKSSELFLLLPILYFI